MYVNIAFFCFSVTVTHTAAAAMQLLQNKGCNIKISLKTFYFLKSDLRKVSHHYLSTQKTQR